MKQFHDSPLIDGKVTTGQVLAATLFCLAIAGGAGLYLLLEVGYPVVIMTAIGAFIVFFYTSPPIKLNYRGLGETMLFIAFGPMTGFGVYFVLTKEFSFEALLASVRHHRCVVRYHAGMDAIDASCNSALVPGGSTHTVVHRHIELHDIDNEFITDILALEGIDPCAENGEYHSFVYDGPLFKTPVTFTKGNEHFKENHWFLELT